MYIYIYIYIYVCTCTYMIHYIISYYSISYRTITASTVIERFRAGVRSGPKKHTCNNVPNYHYYYYYCLYNGRKERLYK